MSLALFTYCLPILSGYVLFVGISGRLDPVSPPPRLGARPSWSLGLRVAATVAAVTTACLFLAYAMPAARAALAGPGPLAVCALLLSCFVTWIAYRTAVVRTRESATLDSRTVRRARSRSRVVPGWMGAERNASNEQGPSGRRPVDADALVGDAFVVETDVRREPGAPGGSPRPQDTAEASPLVATFLEVASPHKLDIPDIPVATADITAAAQAIIDRDQPIALDVMAREEHEVTLGEAEDQIGTLCEALRAEEVNRREIEKHLRITRRALGRVEAESREHSGNKVDALMALEEELENRIRESAALMENVKREVALRSRAEATVAALQRDVSTAERELQEGTEERDKALSTASRSVALARRTARARARLERQLHQTEETLADREATLNGVIRALEKEKGRTREELRVLARQIILHEKRRRAQNAREDVARSVEGQLAPRLARKVAHARPLAASS